MSYIIMITEEELEMLRRASVLYDWVEARIAEVCEVDLEKYKYGVGLYKQLKEESYPLGLLCETYFDKSDLVVLNQCIGNQSYDVIVNDQREILEKLEYLEITQAHEGEVGHLKKLVLDETGRASTYAKYKKTGTKKTGLIIEVEDSAIRHNKVVESELGRIRNACVRKSKNMNYPDNTGLVIAFDDFNYIYTKHDHQALDQLMKTEMIPILGNFSMVFLVGKISKTYYEYRI